MEVKSKTGRIDPAQNEWLDALAQVPCAEVWVLDPTLANEALRLLA